MFVFAYQNKEVFMTKLENSICYPNLGGVPKPLCIQTCLKTLVFVLHFQTGYSIENMINQVIITSMVYLCVIKVV